MFIIIFTFELCYCAVAACSVLRSIAGYVTEDRASRCGARTPVQSKNTSIELYKIILNTYLRAIGAQISG